MKNILLLSTALLFSLLVSCGGNDTPPENKKPDSTTAKPAPPPEEKMDPGRTKFELARIIKPEDEFIDAMATYPNNRLVTTSRSKTGGIRILDAEGKTLKRFGDQGRADSCFHGWAADVAVGPAGSLFVTDGINERFLAFDSTGKFLFATKKGELQLTGGIAVSSDGKVVVSEAVTWNMKAFDLKGNYLNDFSGIKKKGGVVWGYLGGVCADDSGRVYVQNYRMSGPDGDAIHVCKSDGTYERTLEKLGMHIEVYAIAIDPLGRLWVSDVKDMRVYSREGTYLFTLKPEGEAAVKEEITNICISKKGEIYAVDVRGRRILVFK